MKLKKSYLRLLYSLFVNVRNWRKLAALFEDLMTPKELASLSERIQIMKALVQGETQRTISKKLNVSIGKITRGSRVLQYGKTDWKKVF